MASTTALKKLATDWFAAQGWKPFPFQLEAWDHYLNGSHGLVNAPTGSGKTYSLLIPAMLEGLAEGPREKGLRLIWITPIRALAKEILGSAERAIEGLGLPWKAAIRTGDTKTTARRKQIEDPPEILITTPESVHILLATPGYPEFFSRLNGIVIDEWHELLGSKRGVQMELALSRLKAMRPALKIWGISATIGNEEEGLAALLGNDYDPEKIPVVRSHIKKEIVVKTLVPEEIETMPWTGHLGIKMLPLILPVIYKSQSTLIFTNTRSQCEIWYQQLLEADPNLAGWMAMHHGSISKDLRNWVEEALYDGRLKVVVCTSSLDLGVDFRPVETIIQIGGPKGVARFMQRAGRSGHQPGATSKIYFVPTHSIELVEVAALREAISKGLIEDRVPYIRSFDVLIQYMMTLTCSEGFRPDELYREVKTCFAYDSISEDEWQWALNFLMYGSPSLESYEEYRKVGIARGVARAMNKQVVQRHKMSIGTIVGDSSMTIKYVRGKKIGTVEEWFISQLQPGDAFWFAGKCLELVRIKANEVQVRKSTEKNARIPSWQGGRMPFSSEVAETLREQIYLYKEGVIHHREMELLGPLLDLQAERSALPGRDELLVEYFQSKEGHHLVVYPFEGRLVHEGMGALIGQRLGRKKAMSFSIAMNDYGFELVTDQEIPVEEWITHELFDAKDLIEDIQQSINSAEMARRRFRDISKISGLIFQGYPGREKKERHLQASSSLLFDVFREYEPDNLLFMQTYEEVRTFQLEEARLRDTLERIKQQRIVIRRPGRFTPFAFPLIVDRLREKLSTEKLADRIRRMIEA